MTVRVLATDVQERSMLAAARSLDAAGFEVTGVSHQRVGPGLWSRAARERCVAPHPGRDVEGFIDRLVELVQERDYGVLMPGTDTSLLAVSRHRERLTGYVGLGLPDQDVVEGALDRARLAREATRAGLAPPESTTCVDADQAEAAADAMGYPVVIKPVQTVVVTGGIAERRASELVHSSARARAVAENFGQSIVQRRVDGHVISFGGVATARGLHSFVVSRYSRTLPVGAGNVCFSETIATPGDLAERVEALVEGLRWQGIFELELIESVDGAMSALDFNPRPYGSMTLADAAGVPLPVIWCRSVLGEESVARPARVGVHYRWEDADLRHAISRARAGDIAAAIAEVRPRRRVTHAYWRASDPLPAVARVAQMALYNSHRRVRNEARMPLRAIDDLQSVRSQWEDLAQRTANIFATWDWADVWWRHYGNGRRLDLNIVSSGDRVAILPMYVERRSGVAIRRFVGHGVADELGPIADAENLPLAAEGLAALGASRGVLLAERLPRSDGWGLPGGRVLQEEPSPFIDLVAEGSWEDYLARRSSEFRQQARRRARRVERAGITYRLTQDAGRLQVDFDSLLALHRARWGNESQAFRGKREDFHREFAARALERGWLRLWVAEADGKPVAAWYGFRYAGVECYYQSGRDPEWDRLSVGAAILEHSIREAFADGMREYRLLRGDESYKRRYANLETTLSTIVLSHGVVGSALVTAVRLAATARPGRRVLGWLRD